MDFSVIIKGHTLEYYDDTHCYLIDGIIKPSISSVLGLKFSHKYDNIDKEILRKAAARGTEIHSEIERYCKTKTASKVIEVRNFIFLQNAYNFVVLENEVPMILFKDGEPVAAGRCDLVLRQGDKIIGADIKTTAALDKEYLAYQLNLYRIAYKQSYGIEWQELKGIHLRQDVRKYVDIPVCEDLALELLDQYLIGGYLNDK